MSTKNLVRRGHQMCGQRFFLLFLIYWLAACTADLEPIEVTRVTATSIPATFTATTIRATAVATLAPTRENQPQPEATPTPIVDTPTPEPPFCTTSRSFDSTALPTSSHLGRVLFLNDDLWLWRQETATAVPLSTGGNVTAYLNAPDNSAVAYIQDGNLWLWREGQDGSQLSDDGLAHDLRFSADGRFIAYSHAVDDDQYELWAIASDDGAARLLATASAADVWKRNPDAEKIDLIFYWAADNKTLVYFFYPTLLGIGDAPSEPALMVDAETGQTVTSVPIENLADVHHGYSVSFVTQPDGQAELSLVEASSGHVVLTLSTRYNAIWTFSPDDHYLITSSDNSALIIDLADLSQQPLDIPLRTVGVSHYLAAPSHWWQDDTTWYAAVPNSDDVFQPNVTFDLWRVNATDGTVTLINTFSGFVLEVVLSPDKQHFAYWDNKLNGLRDLHIVNLATGQDELYDNSRYSLIFDHWLSDSTHFIYSYQTGDNSHICYLVGQIGQPPMALPDGMNPNTLHAQWVDETIFILDRVDNDGTISLYWQSLHSERRLIGEKVRLITDAPPDASFIVYFAEP